MQPIIVLKMASPIFFKDGARITRQDAIKEDSLDSSEGGVNQGGVNPVNCDGMNLVNQNELNRFSLIPVTMQSMQFLCSENLLVKIKFKRFLGA